MSAIPTLRDLVHGRENDARGLDWAYRTAEGVPLTGEALSTGPSGREITLAASVVIPAWNARETIEACLRAIEASSFAIRRPSLLEVIVVDDGSTDGTRECLQTLGFAINVVLVSQTHRGRAQAMNTGLAIASGDVVISCDADVLPTRWAIEEFIRRHQVIGPAVLVGFRTNVPLAEADSRIGSPRCALARDNRLAFDWPGWPENMIVCSDHLRRLGGGRRLWMPSGERWDLPRMVFGCLFSALRTDLEAVGGYDQRFEGWGWEDTLLAAELIALGRYVVPVYTASGFHVAHPARSPRRWREAAENRRRYQHVLDQQWGAQGSAQPPTSRGLLMSSRVLRRTPHPEQPTEEPCAWMLPEPDDLLAVGRFEDAAQAYAAAGERGRVSQRGAAVFGLGRALRAMRRFEESVAVFEPEVRSSGRAAARGALELGLALAGLGRFHKAQDVLRRALDISPRDRWLRYILRCPLYKHVRRGRWYAAQGDHHIAVRDFEAALLQEPGHAGALRGRDASLSALSG